MTRNHFKKLAGIFLAFSLLTGAAFQFGGIRFDLLTVTSSSSTVVLTKAHKQVNVATGSSNQVYKLPDATGLAVGYPFFFLNESSGTLTVSNSSSTPITTLSQNQWAMLFVKSTATTGGPWANFKAVASGSSSQPTPSTVVCRQTAGAGSTNTAVRRYTNCTTSGTDITVSTDSATLGRDFTIATAGTYSINTTDFAASFAATGITVDGNALTTAPTSLAIYPDSANGMLGGYCSNFSVGQPFRCDMTYRFTAGQVIRVQCSNCGAQSNDNVSIYIVGPLTP